MSKRKQKSVTLTVVVWVCLFLMVLGSIVAIFSLGNSQLFEVHFGTEFVLKGVSIGFGILFVAAITIWKIVDNKSVQLFSNQPLHLIDKLSSYGSAPWLVISLIAIALFLLTVFSSNPISMGA